MTTRTAGRHRITKDWPAPPAPSLLLLDYLESGRFPSGLNVTSSPPPRDLRLLAPPRDRRPAVPPWDRRPAVPLRERRPAVPPRDRRPVGRLAGRRIDWRGLGMATPAVLAGVAVAVVLGGYALLRPPMANGSGHPAVPSLAPPQVELLPPSAPPATPERTRPAAAHRTTAPRRPVRPAASMVPVPAARPSPRASRTAAPPRGPAIVARYLVVRQGPAGFQGEVQVTNNGPQPIAGWRIVIALPEDQVLSFSNAGGFVSDGILLLQPGAGAQPIPARGGTLSVFFAAVGQETTPQACAFNNVVCG
jgi:hypothetical protein